MHHDTNKIPPQTRNRFGSGTVTSRADAVRFIPSHHSVIPLSGPLSRALFLSFKVYSTVEPRGN